jgi:hypothetical protein
MQTLGISDSTPRSDGRLKSLFWPSIQTGADVDYLGSQGYWVCALVALVSFVALIVVGQPIMAVTVLLFYYMSGVGVREHSRYAATMVFVIFVTGLVISGPTVVNILLAALLLSNLRATWIASKWKPDSEEAALPPRLEATWGDKFADKFPMWFWPKIRIPYYIFAAALLVLTVIGVTLLKTNRIH